MNHFEANTVSDWFQNRTNLLPRMVWVLIAPIYKKITLLFEFMVQVLGCDFCPFNHNSKPRVTSLVKAPGEEAISNQNRFKWDRIGYNWDLLVT